MLEDKQALAVHTTIAEHIKDKTGTDSFLDNLQVTKFISIFYYKNTIHYCKYV